MRFKTLLLALCVASIQLTGCSTPPTASQQTTLTVVIDAAVAVAVQNKSNDPATWAERATKIVDIAHQLQALDQGDIATLPALSAALQPMVAKLNLPPADQLAANMLIASLSQVIDQQRGKTEADTKVLIRTVLAAVVDAASVYIPAKVTP